MPRSLLAAVRSCPQSDALAGFSMVSFSASEELEPSPLSALCRLHFPWSLRDSSISLPYSDFLAGWSHLLMWSLMLLV